MQQTEEQDDSQAEIAFHHREWAMQRIGWGLIAVFILLALAGLFGGGPLSEARMSSPQAGTIEYERYTRHGARTALTITPAAAALQGAIVRVAMPRDYLRAFKIETVTPEPTRARMSGEQLIYEFTMASAGASISYQLQPEELGGHSAQIVIGGAAPLTLRQFTYP